MLSVKTESFISSFTICMTFIFLFPYSLASIKMLKRIGKNRHTYLVSNLRKKAFNTYLTSKRNFFFVFCFFKINKFIYLFMAVLGLRCRAWAFSSCGEKGLLFVAVHGLLIAVASLVVEHGL